MRPVLAEQDTKAANELFQSRVSFSWNNGVIELEDLLGRRAFCLEYEEAGREQPSPSRWRCRES